MNIQKNITSTATSLLIISVLFWGLAFPVIKITLDHVPPLVIGYFRYLLASIPFLVYIFLKKTKNEIMNELEENWKVLILLGITMVTIPNITQNIGLLYTTSSIAALISTVAPVFTVIIALTFLHESKTWYKITGLIIALSASILMVLYTGFEMSEATLFGNSLIFITSVSYGICAIFSKSALMKCHPINVAGYGMFFGSIILIPISIIFNEPLDWPIRISIVGWSYLFILTIFPCMIATFLWYVVLESYEVSKQVLFTYLIPVFAAVFAYILLGEILHPITIILGFFIIIGITLAEGVLFKIKINHNKTRKNQDKII
jgi:drug/metabolite transporter (DMT)-like permease